MSLQLLAQQAAGNGGGNDWALILGLVFFGVAVLLFALELFVPTGGLLGVLCAVAAIASILSFFRYDASWGIGALAAYLVLTPITLIFVFKLWLHSPLAERMILGGRAEAIDASSEDSMIASERARLERLGQLRQLIGAQGVTVTALRPIGTVRIDGRRIDAMAEAGVIEPGTPITVTEVYDNQIKVRVS
jgi:membrane-bound ClpP family serine protease